MTLDDARDIHGRYAGLLLAAFVVKEFATSFGDNPDPVEMCSALAKKIESEAERMKELIPPELFERLLETYKDVFGFGALKLK